MKLLLKVLTFQGFSKNELDKLFWHSKIKIKAFDKKVRLHPQLCGKPQFNKN